MHLEIITPEKSVFNEEIDEVLVPTDKGQIGILPHHINLVTKLIQGEIIIKTKSKEKSVAVTGGFLEVANGKITILSDYAKHVDDIDIGKAQDARKRAEEVLKKRREINEQDMMKAQAELRRAILELHVAQRKRHRN